MGYLHRFDVAVVPGIVRATPRRDALLRTARDRAGDVGLLVQRAQARDSSLRPQDMLVLQRTIGNQAVSAMVGGSAGAGTAATAAGRLGAGPPAGLAMAARAPEEREADRIETVASSEGVPTPAERVSEGPRDSCSVRSGPSYNRSGTVPVSTSGHRKRAKFTFRAKFRRSRKTGALPACCEVRQFIKWDKAFAVWAGGPPHSGFPSSTAEDTWIEDRDSSDKRYGHRSDKYSDPIKGCGDEYKTAGRHDQLAGNSYCGRDNPGGPDDLTGEWQFQLKVVDTCSGEAVKATSNVITVKW